MKLFLNKKGTSINEFNNSLDIHGRETSTLENRAAEITKNVTQRKKMEIWTERLQHMRSGVRVNMCVTGVPEGGEKKIMRHKQGQNLKK